MKNEIGSCRFENIDYNYDNKFKFITIYIVINNWKNVSLKKKISESYKAQKNMLFKIYLNIDYN